MSEQANGGAAFPGLHPSKECHYADGGMSLRDWFAGTMTMPEAVQFRDLEAAAEYVEMDNPPEEDDMEGVIILAAKCDAKMRYARADAMLERRAK